jgi:hypothetical protein
VGFVRHYRDKQNNPGLHPGTVGGARNCKFSDYEQFLVEIDLWEKVKANPKRKIAAFAAALEHRWPTITAW